MTSTRVAWVWRILLFPLIVFEFLVVLGVFDIVPDFTRVGLLLTSSAVFLGMEWTVRMLPRIYQHPLHWWVVLIAVLAVYLDAAGDFLHLYSQISHYDTYLHFFGTAAATGYVWNIIRAKYARNISNRMMDFMVITTGITLGVIYEVEEYLEDVFTTSHRLGDGPDTGNDLLMDMIGAGAVVVIAALIRLFQKTRKKRDHR